MDRVILHSDCNSFYASVECFLHPELRDIPVSVGGDSERRHGIILASNQHAKKYGIRTGEPLWEARRKCPSLTIVEPHHEIYHRFSLMAHDIYRDYSERVEPFGPDEAWIDVSDSASSPAEGLFIAREISQRIKDEMGITVSIGVSWNKVFAKLGSDYKKPDAITVITRDNCQQIVYPLPTGALLFVGRSMKRSLEQVGIKTIGDIAATDPAYLRDMFGKNGESLYLNASGQDCSPVALYGQGAPAKSIGNSTTTSRDICTNEDASVVFCSLAENISNRLRKANVRGKLISISIRDVTLCSFTRQKQLSYHTNCSRDIFTHAMDIFRSSYNWQSPIRSLGISVGELSHDNPAQLSLFSDEERSAKRELLETAADELKDRFGKSAVCTARLLTDKELSGYCSHSGHLSKYCSLPTQ